MPAPPERTSSINLGAVIALTKSLAVQFASRGVRSNAICPGPIETPLLTVNAGIFLASDESAWTNGAVLVLDGEITSNYF